MSDFTWTVDRQIKRSTKPIVLKAQFGDGYSQRVATTLNNLTQSWNVSFKNRSSSEIDNIITFLETRLGVTSFTWTPPNGTEIKVTCDTWGDTYVSPTVTSLTATFERVYE